MGDSQAPWEPTIAVDFDGVLHSYRGWTGPEPKGEPIPGSLEAIRELSKDFKVVVFTSRDPTYTRAWLARHGFPALEVTNYKPAALVIVDDRAVTFTGRWSRAFTEKVKSFRAYWDWTKESVL